MAMQVGLEEAGISGAGFRNRPNEVALVAKAVGVATLQLASEGGGRGRGNGGFQQAEPVRQAHTNREGSTDRGGVPGLAPQTDGPLAIPR
jgi:hypothetical protein